MSESSLEKNKSSSTAKVESSMEVVPGEVAYMKAHLAFGELKKNHIESQGRDVLPIDAMIALDNSMKGNAAFDAERAWLKDELVGQVRASKDSYLPIIKHLADNDPALARQLMDEQMPTIQQDYHKLKQEAQHENAHEAQRRLGAYWGTLEEISRRLGGSEHKRELYEKMGMKHPLEAKLRDDKYKYHTIKILHLTPPDLSATEGFSPIGQWEKLKHYLEAVSGPATALDRWRGQSINNRRAWLRTQVKTVMPSAVEIAQRLPNPKKNLYEISLQAAELEKLLEEYSGWLSDVKASAPEEQIIRVPFEKIEDTALLVEFAQFKNRRENKAKDGETRTKEPYYRSEQQRTVFPKHAEKELLLLGIERRDPDLVYEQIPGILRYVDDASTNLKENNDLREIRSVAECDEIYVALAAHFQGTGLNPSELEYFRGHYQKLLIDYLRCADRDGMELVEQRLTEFFNPGQDWDGAMGLIQAMHNSNEERYKISDRSAQYKPVVLVQEAVKTLATQTGEEAAKRRGQLQELALQPRSRIAETLIEEYHKAGFVQDAALMAAKSGNTEWLERIIAHQGESVFSQVLNTTGWDFKKLQDRFRGHLKNKPDVVTSNVVAFYDQYFAKADQEINQSKRASEYLSAIETFTSVLAPREGWERSQPESGEMERAMLEERVRQYKEQVWLLWQQGAIVSEKSRDEALKILVEDGRDEAIIAVSLGPRHRTHLAFAHAEVAMKHGDAKALTKFMTQIEESPKSLGSIEDSSYRLHKFKEYLIERGVTEMSVSKLRQRVEKGNNRGGIIDGLIKANRYEDVVKVLGAQGLEQAQVRQLALKAIDVGDPAYAQQLLNVPGVKITAEERSKIMLCAKVAQGGGQVEKLREKKWEEVSLDELYQKAIKTFASQELSEEEVLLHLQESLAGTNLFPLIQHYVKVRG